VSERVIVSGGVVKRQSKRRADTVSLNRDDPLATRLDEILESAGRGRHHGADEWPTIALEDSFPCSDPISSMRDD
jgi:hypothetical protein